MQRLWLIGTLFVAMETAGMQAQPTAASTTRSSMGAPSTPSKLPAWDVVSVHPTDPQHCTSVHTMRYSADGMDAACAPLLFVIQQAYALLQPTLILNAPEWVKSDRLWNIDAKVAPEDATRYTSLKASEKYSMMRFVLADRFRMKAHMEHKEIPVYELVVAKGGPKLTSATEEEAAKEHVWMRAPGDLEAIHAGIGYLPIMLNTEVGRAIVDRTGLIGRYTFTLKYVPASKAATDESGGPSIFTAIQEQLGLKLQPAKAQMDVLVIDSIELPTTN